MTPTQYRVYVTPLTSAFVYGTETEITDYIENLAGTITKSIDSQDFSVGVYTFNDVQLTCENSTGKMSDSSDSRSMFTYSRDKAKIRIVLDQGDGSPITRYQGLINDEASSISPDTDEVMLVVLGPDSVLKSSKIPVGSITNGMTISQALLSILNTSDIRSVLGVSVANLSPQSNITIDDGTRFDNLNKRDAIATLLGASNSVMTIDSSLNVIVRDRLPNFQNSIRYLYGRGAISSGQENIRSVPAYNTGLQRVFNSVLVTGGQPTAVVTDISAAQQTVTKKALVGSGANLTSQNLYGIRQKSFQFDWLTTLSTLNTVAAGYAAEFAFPKLELQVVVPTPDVASADLLDQVCVSFPLLITPAGKFLPIVGVTKIGDTDSPLPYVKGALSISATLGFKIIEISEDITTFQTTLKLRQIGVTQTDGDLTVPIASTTVTVDTQITSAYDIYFVDCTLGTVNMTLPSPTSNPQKNYTVVKIDSTANVCNVKRFAAETVNGGSQVVYATQYDGGQFGTDRTNWFGYALNRQPVSVKPKTRLSLTNNQVAAANLTGLLFDKTLVRAAIITLDIRRKTDTASSEVRATHTVLAFYNTQADTWSIGDKLTGDDDGITLSITSAGQIQYTSSNIAGANGIHNCDFNAETISV